MTAVDKSTFRKPLSEWNRSPVKHFVSTRKTNENTEQQKVRVVRSALEPFQLRRGTESRSRTIRIQLEGRSKAHQAKRAQTGASPTTHVDYE